MRRLKYDRPRNRPKPPVFHAEGKPCCKGCKYYRFSETLGSPDTPVWHCRDGFRPRRDERIDYDCREMAAYNDWATAWYEQEHAVQLTLF